MDRPRLGLGAVIAVIATLGAAVAWALLVFQGRSLARIAESSLAEQVAADADFAAALVARLPPSEALPPLEGRRITVVDRSGRVVADTSGDPAGMDNHADRPEIVAAIADGRGSSRRRSETVGRTLLYEARRLQDGRVVRIATPLPEGLADAAAPYAAVLLSTAAAIALSAGLLLAHHLRNRSRALELQGLASDLAAGRFDRRASLTSTDAMGLVGRALNALGERLQATVADLDRQRSLLVGALGALHEGVACIDRLDRVAYANAAFARLAADGADVIGHAWYEHLPSASVEGALKAVGTAAPPTEFEHRGRELAASAAPGGPDVLVLVLHDLTEVKRLEGARRAFMASVSHEFKTPLTSIIGFSETLLDGALHDPAVARPFVEKIARHADRLGSLVHDVLALSRLEQGAWEPRPERCDLVRVAAAVLEEAQPAADERRVRLRLDAPPALPATIDAEMVRQVIGNLVSNAVRYNRPDGSARVVLARGDDGRCRISVEDTGIGIPEEHRERVFERFYRIDAHRSRQTGGTGLGLAIVKHLVGQLGGSIDLASGPEGSRFTIVLPVAPA